MSAAKRSRQAQRQSRGSTITAPTTDSNLPASKRLKSSHTTTKQSNGLGALLDQRANVSKKLTATLTNGVPSKSASRVDDAHALVTNGLNGDDHELNANGISDDADDSDAQDSDDEGIDEADEDDSPDVLVKEDALPNGVHELKDVEMVDEATPDEAEEAEEPSFGDMLRARHPEIINVHTELPDPHAEPPHLISATGKDAIINQVTGYSLATVLQQALKTNDKDMLESCFQLRDTQAVRNTIQRLPSPLIGTLLARVAERVYKRPGRAGTLMLWIQWSLVAHGGYLATQPEVLRRLKALNQVIKQRAQGLQPLLQLKGKLDLLSAQLELRRTARTKRRQDEAADEDEALIYVEGDAEDDWDSPKLIDIAGEDAKDAGDADIDDGLEEESSDENEDMLDIEAEEIDEDEEDEDESIASESAEEDDEDEDEDEDESEPDVKTPRPQNLNRKR